MSVELSQPWDLIGPTRLIKISDFLYGKLETENPTGSVKDRPIQYIVDKAIQKNQISHDTVLVEASSGNTGISLSAVGASLGLKVKIVMPSNMSEERKSMMRLFGAEIVDAPPSDFKAAISMRNDLIRDNSKHWSPMQFENDLNIECHRNKTGPEIIRQMKRLGSIDAFFSGAGTGGTIMGVKAAFEDAKESARCMLVVPEEPSDVHGIQGIGDGGDYLVDRDRLSGVHTVKTLDAVNRAKQFALSTGVLIGISAGANICAAERYIESSKITGNVIVLLCDRGERYLSLF